MNIKSGVEKTRWKKNDGNFRVWQMTQLPWFLAGCMGAIIEKRSGGGIIE